MGKLFKLALEEAVVEEPSIVEDVPVEEAVQNAEELAKTDGEIQQDIAAVEELMEEKAKLEDQAVTNDELLSNPDAVVTATDVEVSEETRTEVQYSLGYTSSMDKIRLSQESVLNDVRSNPRKYLAISNEDIKDTIDKIVETIKKAILTLTNKIDIYIKKSAIRSSTYLKSIKDDVDNLYLAKQDVDQLLNNAKYNPDYYNLLKKIYDDLSTQSAETRYALINSDVWVNGLAKTQENADALKNVFKATANFHNPATNNTKHDSNEQTVSEIAAKAMVKTQLNISLFGIEEPHFAGEPNVFVVGVTGKKYLDSNYEVKDVKFATFNFDPDIAKVDLRKLITNIVDNKNIVYSAQANIDSKLKVFATVQKDIIKELDNMKRAKSGNAGLDSVASAKFTWLTRCACSACYFRMKEIIGEIMAYAVLAKSLCEYVKFDKERSLPKQA